MVRNLEYPKKPENTVKRYNSRATYDLGAIHSIINTTSVLHVSFAPSADQPFPAILPMIGAMGSFEYPSSGLDEPLDCYLHGYVSSRLMRLARESPDGLPICVAATKVDGFVLSLTPNSHSYNYRSAVLQGYARLVETAEEKVYAMQLITDKVVAGRWENTRVPPDNVEMTSTTILRVKIESGSGKVRQGGPHDEPKDQTRDEITDKVWTGVVPVYEALDAPVPSATNKVAQIPAYLDRYVSEVNRGNREIALNAVNEP
ncbi:hypothetical protein A1O1_00304 [Capronia coronata CBS 617.96]|uniref:Flavin-nucleotide-binding protein n=1 Tax=Capronia coronata CBS 617.96 TaxID=1182541 RepID=W9YZQ7_9EURO|nr:uncharacterized protein A1O1_00304 [Capronia coronata CBS 617.96]EXJ95185.1 hypothetical protein A1O1_00304 [Capronia coronata CBS 617.96]